MAGFRADCSKLLMLGGEWTTRFSLDVVTGSNSRAIGKGSWFIMPLLVLRELLERNDSRELLRGNRGTAGMGMTT